MLNFLEDMGSDFFLFWNFKNVLESLAQSCNDFSVWLVIEVIEDV